MIWYNDAHRRRSLKSFAAFVAENPLYVYKDKKWVCPQCTGSGRVIADYERPDPVEGYKFADRVPCLECKGTGEYTEKGWRAIYSKERQNQIDRDRKERDREKLVKSALAKLTVGEQKALGVYKFK